MKAYTNETGWVTVIRDDLNHLGMWLCVPGYTFYFAKYQEILAVEDGQDEVERGVVY